MGFFAAPPPLWSDFVNSFFPTGFVLCLSVGLLFGLWAFWRDKVQLDADAARQAKLAAQYQALELEQTTRVRLSAQAEAQRLGRDLSFQEMFLIQAEVVLPASLFARIKEGAQRQVSTSEER